MSEEQGKPFSPFEVVGDEALEARIVAWVLGEASEFEIDELRRLCRERPELEVFRQRIEAVHGLAGESVARLDADWKLPPNKRGKVLEQIGVRGDLARRERSSRLAARRVLLAAAACLVLTVVVAALVFPMFFGSRAWKKGSPAAARMEQRNVAAELAGVEAQMQALDKAMREQEDRVEEKRKVLNTIVETKGIVYSGGSGALGGGRTEGRSAAMNFEQLEQEKAQLQSQLQTLLKYDEKELVDFAAGLSLPGNRVKELQPEYAAAKQQKIELRGSGLGDDHPRVRAQQEIVEDLEKQIGEGVTALRGTLRSQLELTNERLAKMDTLQKERMDFAVKKGIDTYDFVEARQEFEQSREMFDKMRIEYQGHKLALEGKKAELEAKYGRQAGQAGSNGAVVTYSAPPAKEGPASGDEVTVGGQVRTPGSVPHKPGITLGEAVDAADGATEFGSMKRVEVQRGSERQVLDMGSAEDRDVKLKSGDRIFVPQKNWLGDGGGEPNEPPAPTAPASPKPASPASASATTATATPSGDRQAGLKMVPLQTELPKELIEGTPRRIVLPGLAEAESKPASGPAAPTKPPTPAPTPAQAPVARPTGPAADMDQPTAPTSDAGGMGGGGGGVPMGGPQADRLDERAATAARGQLRRSRGGDADDETEAMTKEDEVLSLSGIVTGGLRSGDGAVTRNSIDAILNNPERAKGVEPPADEPVRTGEALAAEQAPDAVLRDLYTGEGLHNLGKFKEAEERFKDVLEKDPQNKAARRGLERAAGAQSDFNRAAYDQTRAELLAEVDSTWELATPADGKGQAAGQAERKGNEAGPAGQVQNGRFDESAGFYYFADRSGVMDGKGDADKDGAVVADPFAAAGEGAGLKVPESTLTGKAGAAEVPVETDGRTALGLELMDDQSRMWDEQTAQQVEGSRKESGYQDLERGVIPAPESAVRQLRQQMAGEVATDEESEVARRQPAAPEFKTYNVEVGLDFLDRLSRLDGDGNKQEAKDPFAEQSAAGTSLLERRSVGDMMAGQGLQLPEGATVAYDAENGKLLVKAPENTLADLEGWIDALPLPPSTAAAIDLMAEVAAADEPFSTFSLHVSDASFRVAVAALERGERPEPEAVRPEEFYNAFDYGDPAPTAGEPVACAIEQCAHPLLPGRNLVRVAVRTAAAGRGAGQALRLTVLLDNSGSMEREDRRAAVQAAMVQLASLLGEQDVVTVVGFARQPRLLADRVSGAAMKEQLEGLVERTPAEGGTNLEQALALADELAMRQFDPAAQNRIVLLTDGAANLGNADPELLAKRVEGLRQRGISFDAAGFGTAGLNDRMLERLTRDGDGRYYVVDGPEEADEQFAKKLAGAFRPAAENVKVQVRFNPARVGGYRLIGFEEHRLKKEDFRDDAVDAAEMAAEEAGVAVYQVELLPEGEGEIGEVSVRFRDAASGRMVERSWTMPHDAGAPAFDQAPASMQVAGLALLAADVLRGGPLAPLTDWSELAPVSNRVRAEFGGSGKVAQLLRMVEKLRE